VSFGSIQRYSSSCSPNSYPIDPLSRLRLWLFFSSSQREKRQTQNG
jgi:hypothetical protein